MRCSRTLLPVLVLSCFGFGCDRSATTIAANEPGRVVEPAGGFSFVPPSGWTWREVPGLKFKIAVGPVANGFAPNINFIEESFSGSVEQYGAANMTVMKSRVNVRVVREEAFATSAGMNGMRSIFENQSGQLLRQTWYFFAQGSRKFVITCSALANGGETLDPAFEASMKTFRFDSK